MHVIFGHEFLDYLLALNYGKKELTMRQVACQVISGLGVTESLNCASDDDAMASTVRDST
jgi:hypothetical protein